MPSGIPHEVGRKVCRGIRGRLVGTQLVARLVGGTLGMSDTEVNAMPATVAAAYLVMIITIPPMLTASTQPAITSVVCGALNALNYCYVGNAHQQVTSSYCADERRILFPDLAIGQGTHVLFHAFDEPLEMTFFQPSLHSRWYLIFHVFR